MLGILKNPPDFQRAFKKAKKEKLIFVLNAIFPFFLFL
jgi:hypothetical protein